MPLITSRPPEGHPILEAVSVDILLLAIDVITCARLHPDLMDGEVAGEIAEQLRTFASKLDYVQFIGNYP